MASEEISEVSPSSVTSVSSVTFAATLIPSRSFAAMTTPIASSRESSISTSVMTPWNALWASLLITASSSSNNRGGRAAIDTADRNPSSIEYCTSSSLPGPIKCLTSTSKRGASNSICESPGQSSGIFTLVVSGSDENVTENGSASCSPLGTIVNDVSPISSTRAPEIVSKGNSSLRSRAARS